jgi:O-succinylbenzoate synthase
LQNAIEIHNLCQEAGVPCWVGGMLESSIGAAICLALATLDNFVYPNDIFPSDRFYREEISEPKVELSGPGLMKVSDVPGIPYEPIPERLEERTISKVLISS